MHKFSRSFRTKGQSTVGKRKKSTRQAGAFGAANQNRTGDLIITNDVLYRLSHSSEPKYIIASPCRFVKSFCKIFFAAAKNDRKRGTTPTGWRVVVRRAKKLYKSVGRGLVPRRNRTALTKPSPLGERWMRRRSVARSFSSPPKGGRRFRCAKPKNILPLCGG